MASNYQGILKNYAQALKALDAKSRNKDRVYLQYETFLIRKPDGVLAIELFGHEIIQYHPKGPIVLNSCGYRTVTTKDRINRYNPAYIIQARGIWYITNGIPGYPHSVRDLPLFEDGMKVNNNGKVQGLSKKTQAKNQARLKEVNALNVRIKKYADGFLEALFACKVPKPSGGDCWHCCLVEEKSGKPWGEEAGNTEHLTLHFDEDYYVPSLLANAVKKYPISMIASDRVARLMAGEDVSKDGSMNDIAKEQIHKSLVRYLKFCFKIAG